MNCAGCGGSSPEGMRFCGHCGARLASAGAASGETSGEGAIRRMVSRQVAERLGSGGEITDEWRLVTSLFADISGYVALSERLDPEALVDATAPIVSMMTSVAERYQAHVAKFAGDALLCMFGAPVVHEDDADRALLAALDMLSELDRIRPDLPEDARDLDLHIGINTGRVVAAVFGAEDRIDYNVAGEAVNLAQRLESIAPGGEVYVGDSTAWLTRSRFEFERVGEIALKGLSAPVVTWRLVGRPSANAGDRASASRQPFVGREPELATLRGALERVLSAQGSIVTGSIVTGSIVTIEGDAGAGKSRLVEEATLGLETKGVAVARCAFGSLPSRPYQACADLLRNALGIGSAGELPRVLFGLGCADAEPYLTALLSAAPSVPSLDPETFAAGVAASAGRVLARLSETEPVVLVVEDLHWADASSIAVLEEIAFVARSRAIAFIATSRPAGDSLSRLSAHAPTIAPNIAHTIALGPLPSSDVDELLENLLAGSVPSPIREAVADRAGGNPYFIEEMVRYSIERGTVSHGVPPTIEGVIAARIDRLPSDAANVLQVVAVTGTPASKDLVELVLDEPVELEGALRALEAARLVDVIGDDLRFHHALIADVVYERLLRRRRSRLHRAVADATEALFGSGDDVVDSLARHRLLSGDNEAAFPILVRAGVRARELYANDTAISHFESALEIAPPDRRTQMLLAVGEIADVMGDYERAQAAFQEAARSGGGLDAVRGLAATLRKRGSYAESLEVLEDALRRGDSPAIRLEQGWTMSVAGRYADAIRSLRRGLAASGENRDPISAKLLLELARAETVERELEQALVHSQESRSIFEECQDVRGVAMSIRVAGAALHRLGRLDEAVSILEEGLALAEKTGSVEEQGACLINLGMVELERGNLKAAISHDRLAIEQFERIGHGSGRAIGYGNLAEKLLRTGALEEAEAWCDKALRHAGAIHHRPTVADVTKTQALIAVARGDNITAAAKAGEAADLYEQMGLPAEAADARRIASR